MSPQTQSLQLMRGLHVEKVTVHMGVGESGELLTRAESLLEELTGQKPVRCNARIARPTYNIRKGEPIGCKVTLRYKRAIDFLKTALTTIDNKLYDDQFDNLGNFAFGIEEHTDFPGQEYDPEIGIFGMDILVQIVRPGNWISRRRRQRQKIPTSHRCNPGESQEYLKQEFNVEVI